MRHGAPVEGHSGAWDGRNSAVGGGVVRGSVEARRGWCSGEGLTGWRGQLASWDHCEAIKGFRVVGEIR